MLRAPSIQIFFSTTEQHTAAPFAHIDPEANSVEVVDVNIVNQRLVASRKDIDHSADVLGIPWTISLDDYVLQEEVLLGVIVE